MIYSGHEQNLPSWLVDQPQLLPPSVTEFVPEGHVAHFVRNLARDELDLSAILAAYEEQGDRLNGMGIPARDLL